MVGSDGVAEHKRELRQRLRHVRDRVHPSTRECTARAAAEHLFASPLVQGTRTIMLYSSIKSEVDTRWLMEASKEQGMRIALPRVDREQWRIEAVWVDKPDDLEPGTMGILEPKAQLPAVSPSVLDLIIVPGLGFDRRGYRLGYGAGHYDQFLPKADRATLVGLTYDACLVDSIPRESHDQPVQFILTGSGLSPVLG